MRLLEKEIKSEYESTSPQTRASYPDSGGEGECPMCGLNPALVAQLQHLRHAENKILWNWRLMIPWSRERVRGKSGVWDNSEKGLNTRRERWKKKTAEEG